MKKRAAMTAQSNRWQPLPDDGSEIRHVRDREARIPPLLLSESRK
jgi:hypothetical protein